MSSQIPEQRWIRAFSLVELMVVVSIIALLVNIALPKFQIFVAKARQTEVKLGLKTVFAVQTSYHNSTGAFKEGATGNRAPAPNECIDTSLLDIGFRVNCAKSRYIYLLTYATADEFAGHGFSNINGVICRCNSPVYGAAYDAWGINERAEIYGSFSDTSLFRNGTAVVGDCTKVCF